MLIAIGNHPKTGEGHQERTCCSRVLYLSPACLWVLLPREPELSTEAAFLSWSALLFEAACSGHPPTLKCSSEGPLLGVCPVSSADHVLLCVEASGLLGHGETFWHGADLPRGWDRAIPAKHPPWLCPRVGGSKTQGSAHG